MTLKYYITQKYYKKNIEKEVNKLVENEVYLEQNLINKIFSNIHYHSFYKIEDFILKKPITLGINFTTEDNNNTQIVFKKSKIIDDDKIPLLLQLYQHKIIDEQEVKD